MQQFDSQNISQVIYDLKTFFQCCNRIAGMVLNIAGQSKKKSMEEGFANDRISASREEKVFCIVEYPITVFPPSGDKNLGSPVKSGSASFKILWQAPFEI